MQPTNAGGPELRISLGATRAQERNLAVLTNRVRGAVVFAAFYAIQLSPLPAQSDCVEAVPAQARPWVPDEAEALVGTWQITMMNVASGPRPVSYRQFNLRFQEPDSVQRSYWPSVSLIGDIATDVPSTYQSHDPMMPPPIVLWDHRVQLGVFGTVDGPGYDVLRPQASTHKGFWGEWGQVEGFGIAVQHTESGYVPLRVKPARGYFCARRLPETSTDSGPTAQ